MRILILNQPFAPDVVATAQLAKDLADDLVARDHEVTAIASRSTYGEKGAVLPKREVIDGIEVRRVGSSIFGKSSTIGRIFDFGRYYVRATLLGVFSRRYDVVIALTTPPYIALAGWLIKKLRGSRLIYWVMDVYPDVMVAHRMLREDSPLHRILIRLHRAILNRSDATVALGRCMRDRLLAHGADPTSIQIITPWSPAPGVNTAPSDQNRYREEWRIGDRLLVMYSGNFGLAHDVDTFLNAAKELRGNDRIRFAFVGGGVRKPEVETFIASHNLPNCISAPYQPLPRLPELLSAADAHLVTMSPEMSGLVVPSKFFGIAGASRPAIFIGPGSSEVATCIEEWRCGSVLATGEAAPLVTLLQTWEQDRDALLQMGRRARAGFEQSAERSTCTDRIAALVEKRC